MLEGSEDRKNKHNLQLEVSILSFKKKSIRKVVLALCVWMTVSAFMIAPASATEEPVDFGQYYCVVTASTLNVSSYASTDAEILATLPMGSYIKVNWVEPGWVNVAYNGDGLMGFVSADYVSVYEGAIPEFNYSAGQSAVEVAKQFLGVPYVYGGTSPKGFDCSGLMQYVYAQLGYSINRVAADQMKNGIPVSREELVPGDLVGFYSSPGSGYVSHIGMYVGDGMMIHAPHTGDVVRFTSIDGSYYGSRFAGGRRIIY